MRTGIVSARAIIALACLAELAGCVSSTGVVRTGPDTFMVSHREKGFKNGSEMKAAALAEANNYCATHGKVMKVVSASQKDMVPFTSDAYAEIHFKALDASDPEARAITDTGSLSRRVFEGNERRDNLSVETSAPAPPKDTYDEIEKLGALLDKGLITQAEFEAEKKKLLAR